jgi:hypothetical protein
MAEVRIDPLSLMTWKRCKTQSAKERTSSADAASQIAQAICATAVVDGLLSLP